MRRPILLVLFYAVTASAAFAERLPLTRYSTANGLPHDRVSCVVRDCRGFAVGHAGLSITPDGGTFTSRQRFDIRCATWADRSSGPAITPSRST